MHNSVRQKRPENGATARDNTEKSGWTIAGLLWTLARHGLDPAVVAFDASGVRTWDSETVADRLGAWLMACGKPGWGMAVRQHFGRRTRRSGSSPRSRFSPGAECWCQSMTRLRRNSSRRLSKPAMPDLSSRRGSISRQAAPCCAPMTMSSSSSMMTGRRQVTPGPGSRGGTHRPARCRTRSATIPRCCAGPRGRPARPRPLC